MKRNLYLFFLAAVFFAASLTSCVKVDENPAENMLSPSASPYVTSDVISQDPIAFVFFQNEESLFNSLYHQLAYLQMESAGYNVTNIYVNEDTDLSEVFTGFENDEIKYVIITSTQLKDKAQSYLGSTSTDMIFIQNSKYSLSSIFSYQIKLYEYYYLAGIALAEVSQTMSAGFVADNPDELTVSCINAFALGMKSVDENSTVNVSWIEPDYPQADINQAVQGLIGNNCDVLAYCTLNDAPESAAENAKIYYMTMSTHQMLNESSYLMIKPAVSLQNYYSYIINSGVSATESSFAYVGIDIGAISYELAGSAGSNVLSSVSSAYQKIQNGYEIFSGPIYGDVGLIVPEGTSLPDEDILDMLWFVENVIGSLPAG